MILGRDHSCEYPDSYRDHRVAILKNIIQNRTSFLPLLVVSPTSNYESNGITCGDPPGETTSANTKANPAKRNSFFVPSQYTSKLGIVQKQKKLHLSMKLLCLMWALRDSNPRPPRCKRGALNQLS